MNRLEDIAGEFPARDEVVRMCGAAVEHIKSMRSVVVGGARAFDDIWPTISIPGEFDAMDQCDQQRWRAAVEHAWTAGGDAERERCAKLCDDYQSGGQDWAAAAASELARSIRAP